MTSNMEEVYDGTSYHDHDCDSIEVPQVEVVDAALCRPAFDQDSGLTENTHDFLALRR